MQVVEMIRTDGCGFMIQQELSSQPPEAERQQARTGTPSEQNRDLYASSRAAGKRCELEEDPEYDMTRACHQSGKLELAIHQIKVFRDRNDDSTLHALRDDQWGGASKACCPDRLGW